MPPSLTFVAVAVSSWLFGRLIRSGMSTGCRKYRRRSRTMKFSAALKHRVACKGVSGFCSTKFAPNWNACCVVVFPFTTAKATDFALLCVWRMLSQQFDPVLEVVAVDDHRVELPLRQQVAARLRLGQTCTRTEIFSSAGRSTPSKAASRLIRSESRFMAPRC